MLLLGPLNLRRRTKRSGWDININGKMRSVCRILSGNLQSKILDLGLRLVRESAPRIGGCGWSVCVEAGQASR
jgi:hypothetical protein